jgi:hypothetical protein
MDKDQFIIIDTSSSVNRKQQDQQEHQDQQDQKDQQYQLHQRQSYPIRKIKVQDYFNYKLFSECKSTITIKIEHPIDKCLCYYITFYTEYIEEEDENGISPPEYLIKEGELHKLINKELRLLKVESNYKFKKCYSSNYSGDDDHSIIDISESTHTTTTTSNDINPNPVKYSSNNGYEITMSTVYIFDREFTMNEYKKGISYDVLHENKYTEFIVRIYKRSSYSNKNMTSSKYSMTSSKHKDQQEIYSKRLLDKEVILIDDSDDSDEGNDSKNECHE